MVKLVLETDTAREDHAFSTAGGAMHFAAELLAKTDAVKMQILDTDGAVLFAHNDIANACRQVRS